MVAFKKAYNTTFSQLFSELLAFNKFFDSYDQIIKHGLAIGLGIQAHDRLGVTGAQAEPAIG